MTMLSLAPYIVYAAIAVCLILIGVVIHLEIKVKHLLAGKDGKSLEDSIIEIQEGWHTERKFKEEMQKYLLQVEKRLSRGIRGVETLRFNAFQGTGSGGNQSFTTVYTDEKGNGVIITGLNARERMSLFSKPLKSWRSDFELIPEEKEALDKAKQSIII